ncbi:MAG: D-alanyl-D-alanine carboxypeptidase [Mollicutes bacterium]|nr:D-alanyl-D-alanine carboxypeptidase [Mollicutes bacterium]
MTNHYKQKGSDLLEKCLIVLVIFFIGIFNAYALEIASEHAVMYNLNDGTIVFEKNKDEVTKVASLNKIMTTLVAIEQIDNLNETVVVNDNMFYGLYEEGAAVIGLVNGQVVTYEDLLYGTFISSGADATRALTISLAGSEDDFVKLMNQKANILGLTNTHFVNATGLDAEGQISTVDDVAKLLMYALKNDLFKTIFESQTYDFKDSSLKLYSTLYNTSIKYGIDTDIIEGAKTGYTDEAGLCLASVAHDTKNDIKYLLVTAKAPVNGYPYHVEDALKIYDYYFSNYKYYNVVKKDEELINLDTKYNKVKNITIKADKDITLYYDNTFNKDLVTFDYNGPEKISPNFKKGEKIGTIDVYYDDKKIDVIDVVLNESIPFSLSEFFKEPENLFPFVLFWGAVLLVIGRMLKQSM